MSMSKSVTHQRPWTGWIMLSVLALVFGVAGGAATAVADQSLHAYCSGPGKDYKECMRKGEQSQAMSPGLRDHCSRRGRDFDECVERSVGRSSVRDMRVYCSGPGKDYDECMDELMSQRRRRW